MQTTYSLPSYVTGRQGVSAAAAPLQVINPSGTIRVIAHWSIRFTASVSLIMRWPSLLPAALLNTRSTTAGVPLVLEWDSRVARPRQLVVAKTFCPSPNKPPTTRAEPSAMRRARVLGGVDGFDKDEAKDKGNNGTVVLGCLLAAEGDALEALELAHKLLDASAGPVERLRKEPWPGSGR